MALVVGGSGAARAVMRGFSDCYTSTSTNSDSHRPSPDVQEWERIPGVGAPGAQNTRRGSSVPRHREQTSAGGLCEQLAR